MKNRATVHRRTVLTGIAGSAAAAVLAACGAGSPATTTPAAPINPPAATTPPTASVGPAQSAATPATAAVPAPATGAPAMTGGGRKVAIQYWHINTDRLGGPAVQEIVKRFNETSTTVALKDTPYPDHTKVVQAVQAGLAANAAPAVAQVGYVFMRYVAGNFPHLPVADIVKRDAQGAEFLKNMVPSVLALGQVDGVQHGVPLGISLPVLYYNAELFRQAGLDGPPKTWAEVREYARRIKERTGKFGVNVAEDSSFAVYQALLESNGARLIVGSGKDVRTGVDGPEAIEAMQFAQDMVLKDRSAVHVAQGQAQMSFKSGEIAMLAIYSSSLETYREGSAFTLGAAPFPTFDAKPRRVPVGGNALFIFARDPQQQQAAWEWIRYLHTPETLTTWVRGTGYLPPRQDVIDDPRYLKSYFDEPLLKAPTSQLPDVTSLASFPGANGLQVLQEFVDAREKILNGQDVAATLRDTARRVNETART